MPSVHGGAASSETLGAEMLEHRRSSEMHVQWGWQRVGMPGLGSLPLTYLQISPTNAVLSAHRRVTWSKTKREVSCALKPRRRSLNWPWNSRHRLSR